MNGTRTARTTWCVWCVAALAMAMALGCGKLDRASAAAPAPQAASAPASGAATNGPRARASLLEIRAQIDVEVPTAADARALVERLGDAARAVGGWVAEEETSTDEGRARLVLRVPPPAIASLRAQMASAGAIVRASQTATDVTDAIADLEARGRAAHAEEQRLLDLLSQRTGSVGDVLAASRALADVRERIERLDAEARVAHERVDLATVEIAIAHPAAHEGGTVRGRLVAAAGDGVATAGAFVIGAATLALRALPTLAIAAAMLVAMIASLRGVARARARRDRARGL